MMESPRSLTAIVHVKFNYNHTKEGATEGNELELLDAILDKVTDMDPRLQELVAKFAECLKQVSGDGQGS